MIQRLQRLITHRWREAGLQRIFTPARLLALTQQVATSEHRHSGEIRIVIEAGLPLSYLLKKQPLRALVRARALSLFGKLRVWDTAQNNGVLIYLLLAERAIEIVADRGLNEQVTPAVWQALVARMRESFRQGEFEAGLAQAVGHVSDLLQTHFALQPGAANANELPNEPHLL